MSVPMHILEEGMDLSPIKDLISVVDDGLKQILLQLQTQLESEDPNCTERDDDPEIDSTIAYQIWEERGKNTLVERLDDITNCLQQLYTVRLGIRGLKEHRELLHEFFLAMLVAEKIKKDTANSSSLLSAKIIPIRSQFIKS